MVINKLVDESLNILFGPPRKIGRIEREILAQLTGGDLLVGFLCSARSTKLTYRTAFQRARARYAVKKAITRLERDGFVARSSEGDHVMLTAMGRSIVRRETEFLRNTKRKRRTWDHVWRIVSFDIPAEHRITRTALRKLLTRAGFMQAQKSVYIYPHDCAELMRLLRENRNLAKYTFYCIANAITSEIEWKKKFGLK